MGIEKQVVRETVGLTDWLHGLNAFVHQVSREIVTPQGGEDLFVESFDELAFFFGELTRDPEKLIRDSAVIDIDEGQSKLVIYFDGYHQSRLSLKYKDNGLAIALERKTKKGSYKGESWISIYENADESEDGSTLQIVPALEHKIGDSFEEVVLPTTTQLSLDTYARSRTALGNMLEHAQPYPYAWVRMLADTTSIIAQDMVDRNGRDIYSEDINDIARLFASWYWIPTVYGTLK